MLPTFITVIIIFAAPQWLVLGAGAFRLAARVALQWAVGESAVPFGEVLWESDLFLEAVCRAALLPAVVSLASELWSFRQEA